MFVHAPTVMRIRLYFMPSFLDENTVLEVEPIIISIAVVNSALNI
jgi:hypothetical protein